jgi:hypothetical protein
MNTACLGASVLLLCSVGRSPQGDPVANTPVTRHWLSSCNSQECAHTPTISLTHMPLCKLMRRVLVSVRVYYYVCLRAMCIHACECLAMHAQTCVCVNGCGWVGGG